MRRYLTSKNLLLAVLLIATIFLFFFRLGFFPFLDYDEATYALVLYESFQSGDFLTFTRLDQPWIDKPPLLFWLAAASAKIFGFNEFALRFPSALLGIMAILLTWLVAFRLSNNYWIAFLAGAILLFSGEFIYATRQMRFDVPVTAAILFSTYCFIRGWERPWWYLGFGVGIALGILFKSVIGLLAFPIAFILSIVYKRWAWFKNIYFWLGMALSFILFAPWFIYESMQLGGDFLRKFIVHSTINRFTRSTATLAYYPKLLFQYMQPWISMFIISVCWFFIKFKSLVNTYKLPLASLSITLFIFLLLEITSTKLFYYLEPIYPFMAIFLASIAILIFMMLQTMTRKRIFIIILTTLFIVSFVNTLWQIFEIGGGREREYALAGEEKIIGLYLTNQQISNKIYTSNFYNYETIFYYSHGKNGGGEIIEIAPLKETIITSPESFFLIIPRKILEIYELDDRLESRAVIVYVGDILIMFEIRAL